jgi:hypothetical protein
MQVSKITELTVFESPDGGRTVYARNSGNPKRELHWQDPKLQQELAGLEMQKRWVDIFQARQDNTELNHLCEQVEILYELSKKST